jgi:predicted ATP-grasp superfamily ATP-dependent carboligase
MSVLVGEERPHSLAASSRYCAGEITYPSAYRRPDLFGRFLVELVTRERIDVVMPVTDVTTHAAARHRDSLCGASACAIPELEAFELAADKRRLLDAASACGITIPKAIAIDSAASLAQVLPSIGYPVVIKPTRSRIPTSDGWMPTSVHYADNQATLLGLYRKTPYLADYPTLIQQRVVGPGMGVFALCDRGRPLTMFAHRRLREKPPSGGASVLSESVAVDPALRLQAERLLGQLRWHGVAMLEYKQDQATGQSVLMEVNGRFWGSLQLAIDAGVDFPYLTTQLARHEVIDAPANYALAVKNRWFLGDLDRLVTLVFRDIGDFPPGCRTRWQAVHDFIRTSGARNETLRRDDPKPGFHELWTYVAATITSIRSRGRTRAARSGLMTQRGNSATATK